MALSKSDCRKAAQATYRQLAAAYPTEGAYWRAGHSFDTIVDYYLHVDRTGADAFAGTVLEQYQNYNPTNPDYWNDDHGWWGIAGLKASAAPQVFGSAVQRFLSIADASWKMMVEKAPNGWKDRQPADGYADYAPLHAGGVWNHTLTSQYNPGLYPDSISHGLAARQNTVTNGLYLVLAERLALAGRVNTIVAGGAFEFLIGWFDDAHQDLRLLNDFHPGQSVVRERVSYFKSGKQDPYYDKDLAWAGDQGLIVGGLVDRMALVGRASPEYAKARALAIRIMNGTKDYLARNDAQPGILQPWTRCPPGPCPFPGAAPGQDPDDYWTGPAVYMRYLLSAFANGDLKACVLENYPKFIEDNAAYVVKNPGSMPGPSQPVVSLTNDLAILVAAVAMLPD